MLLKEYELYVESNIKLARSICIKSQQTIEAVNQYLQELGIVLKEVDPAIYKYYVNLKGLYWSTAEYMPDYSHITEGNDQVMFIKDLDNGNVEMQLSVDTLPDHPLTLSELRSFGNFYRELVDHYPEQEVLIRRIIDPIPYSIQEIIEMEDGKILFYDNRLVGRNEVSLMSDFQQWVYDYLARYQVLAFANSDVLYPAAQLGILRLAMVNVLMDLRLDRIKTAEVCDFHIWSYLAGYFRLDRFKRELTNEQALFLYRNIDYIVNHAGTKETLLFIYQNMIKDYGMKLNTFELRQDSTNLPYLLENAVKVSKFPIDAENLTEQLGTRISVEDLIDKIKLQGKLNRDFIKEDTEKTRAAVLRSVSSNIATGIIECEKEHMPYRGLISHVDETFNMWFWLAGNDKFNYQFALQVDGRDDVYLTAKQSALLLLWCMDRVIHFDEFVQNGSAFNDVIPTSLIIPDMINGVNVPPYSSMNQIVTQGFYDAIDGTETGSPVTTSLFDIENINITTLEAMMSLVEKIEQWKMRARLGLGQFTKASDRANAGLAIKSFMTDAVIDLREPGIETWSAFIDDLDLELNPVSMGKEGIMALAELITEHFVGNIKVQEGITSPHYEMMQILRLLSSYLVTFVAGDASAIARPLEWSSLVGHTHSITDYYRFYVKVPLQLVDFSIEVIEP